MRCFSCFLFYVSCVTAFLLAGIGLARADDALQFSTVAPGDPLQTQLQIVRSAGWSNPGLTAVPVASTPAALTRYEMALETAKAIIAVRARHNADSHWDRTASPQSLRALRALCVAFQGELQSFDVDVPATLKLLDDILSGVTKKQTTETETAGTETPRRRLSTPGSTPEAPPSLQLSTRRDDQGDESLIHSLSQRLRVYSALDSLARQQNDPFAAAPPAFLVHQNSSANSGGVQRLRAGATFEISPSLQLRADFQNLGESVGAVPARGLRDFLDGLATDVQNDPLSRGVRSIGAGVNLNLLSGVTISGGVTHIDELSGGDALRYEGGVGFSGWQNRVALSAHLSRLVPEDSMALGVTAARLNLGVGLTSQIQLKLMYQQMFGANAALQTNPRFGGGLDFSF